MSTDSLLQIYNCKCPKRCTVCQQLLWNLSQHAMECQVCGVVIHKQCYAAEVCSFQEDDSTWLVSHLGSKGPHIGRMLIYVW